MKATDKNVREGKASVPLRALDQEDWPVEPSRPARRAPLFAAAALSALLVIAPACGCAANNGGSSSNSSAGESGTTVLEQAPSISGTVVKHERYDAAVTDLTTDDFANAGFAFGDSCDVVFSSGYVLTDVPYFDGYYVRKSEPVIVAYPKDPFVDVANNNSPLWSISGLSDGDTVTITLNTPGKYRSTYEALSQTYSVDRADYATDEQFSNFRALRGGNLKDNFLYRGASPVDNSRNRAAITNSLLEQYGITDILDLADTDANMEKYFASSDFSSEYARNLYEQGADVVLGMASDYDASAYKEGVAKGMRHLIANGGPAYIHCMEGKDRTGFVCMLVEALAGASYDEMCADYMTTYANYYGITADGTPERYDAIVSLYFNDLTSYLGTLGGLSEDELKETDYTQSARRYLLSCGMTDDEIDQLVALITK